MCVRQSNNIRCLHKELLKAAAPDKTKQTTLAGFTVILQYFYSDKWLIIQISHQRCLWHISHLIASEGPNQVIIPRWGHGCITALKSNAKSEQHSSVTQLDNHLSNNWLSNLWEGWKKIIHSGIQMITAFSLWFTQKKKCEDYLCFCYWISAWKHQVLVFGWV